MEYTRNRKVEGPLEILSDLLLLVIKNSRKRKVYAESVGTTGYERQEIGEELFVAGSVHMSDDNLMDGMTYREMLYVNKITKQMRRYNMFWYDAPSRSCERQAIAKMKERKILWPTSIKHLYIVNPMSIRKGKVLGTILASMNALRDCEDYAQLHTLELAPPRTQFLLDE